MRSALIRPVVLVLLAVTAQQGRADGPTDNSNDRKIQLCALALEIKTQLPRSILPGLGADALSRCWSEQAV